MVPILGNITLILSLLCVLLQIVITSPSTIGKPGYNLTKLYQIGAFTVLSLVLTSFSCLISSYITSDFSVLNVYKNSHTIKPLLYKITGSWGNHEGSMLLLITILCVYNAIMITYCRLPATNSNSQKTDNPYIHTAYITQLLITAGFLSFIILTSNPFERIAPVPENGLGLNPLLQDVGLAIHPPILYIGYIGFSVVFSYAIAALIQGKASKEWAAHVRKFALISWGFLTLGVGLGSWWAYRELGWGGFWFWDPVENVSLLPWLSAISVYHSLFTLEKRGTFALWTIFLSILTFCLSLIGIFLVRSGILSSVHSFASDPSRGLFILFFLGFTGISAFLLFSLRTGKFITATRFPVFSRETTILLSNIFFITLSFTVLLGTVYPIFLELTSSTRVSVGAPYFNNTFNYIALIVLILAGLAPTVSWDKANSSTTLKKQTIPLLVGTATTIAAALQNVEIITILALFAAVFLLTATLQILIVYSNNKITFRKLSPRGTAMFFAHSGAAVLAIGITFTTAFGVEKEEVLDKGSQIAFAGYTATLQDGELGMEKNYLYRRANFSVTKDAIQIAKLSPEIRVYPIEGSSTIEAAIHYNLLSNIYIAIGEVDKDGTKYATRIYYKPLVNLIWLGCIMMSAGGFLAIRNKKAIKPAAGKE